MENSKAIFVKCWNEPEQAADWNKHIRMDGWTSGILSYLLIICCRFRHLKETEQTDQEGWHCAEGCSMAPAADCETKALPLNLMDNTTHTPTQHADYTT